MRASTPIFDFDEHRFDLGDVVLAAIAWDEWQMLERELAEGLACEAEAERTAEPVDPEELRAKVIELRRSRRLLAGQDYLSWLADRSLDQEDVLAHLRRRALRQRMLGRQAPVGTHGVATERVSALIQNEAVLSGQLDAWSQRLARSAAARRGLAAHTGESAAGAEDELQRLLEAARRTQTCGLDEAAIEARAPRVAEHIASESAFRALTAPSDAIEQRLVQHRLDWQRLVWREATFRSDGAAREAALMVREDGIDLESVAALGHGDTRDREAYLSDIPELANLLSAAVPGDLVGPFQADGGWRLALVIERAGVNAADPMLRSRMAGEIVEDALLRHLAGRVSWHASL